MENGININKTIFSLRKDLYSIGINSNYSIIYYIQISRYHCKQHKCYPYFPAIKVIDTIN